MNKPSFKSLEELSVYLSDQEKRIQDLEEDNAALLCDLENQFVKKDKIQEIVTRTLPKTGLLSESLFTRAFSVWGHFVFAQIFIGIILALGYIVIFIFILKAV